MSSLPSMIQIIKQAAVEAMDASNPTNVLFGTVLSTNPLQIKIDQKITLTKEFLVLSRNVTDYETTVTVDWQSQNGLTTAHSHSFSGNTGNAGDVSHNHSFSGNTETANLTHSHGIKGDKKITIHTALSTGDEVILLKMQGGQKYVVLDKVGG